MIECGKSPKESIGIFPHLAVMGWAAIFFFNRIKRKTCRSFLENRCQKERQRPRIQPARRVAGAGQSLVIRLIIRRAATTIAVQRSSGSEDVSRYLRSTRAQ